MMTMTKKLASLALTTAGILSVALAMATVGDSAVVAAPTSSGPQNVLVVNPATQPVPMVATGTTAIAGAVTVSGTVSVGNTITAHLDSNEVIVDNTVPLVTRDADGGTPVSFHAESPAGFASGQILNYHVPAGKRLVVEYVSMRVMGGDDSEHIRGTIEFAGGPITAVFQKHYLIPTAIASNDRLFSTPMTMYFGPGESVGIGFERNSAASTVELEVQLTGRLVDAP
jgi:hypothetical protein